jgi:hypothetical protein
MFLSFSLDVRDCLGGLGGQHVRDDLAAVEISRSSFRRFFCFVLTRFINQLFSLFYKYLFLVKSS